MREAHEAKRYLIIGAGIAGLSAAEAIREVDAEGSITVITKENNLPYSRPMLTKTPFVSFDPGDWTIHDEGWFRDKNIDLHIGEEIIDIDMEKKEASSDRGVYPFDELILATGSFNFIPPIEGKDKKGVYSIREAEDIYEIKTRALPGAKAVIIGGGVIGMEAAMELIRYGVYVTVLEAMPYLMMRQIDEEMSDGIRGILAPEIEVVTGASIKALEGEERVEAVSLTDGRIFPADFVIFATGTRGNVGLGEKLGLEMGRAIKIDDHARTSQESVYAAGDTAEYEGTNYALWSQGQVQGRVAGLNAAGREAFFDRIDSSLVIDSPFLSLCAMGDLGKQEGADYEVKYLKSEDDGHFFYVNPQHGKFFEKQYWLDGKMVGVGILGNLSNMQERKVIILGDTGVKNV